MMTHRPSRFALAFLALITPTLAASPVGDGQTWHVAAGADPILADGSTTLPFASIQVAIDTAADGDTIQIGPGTYHEFNILVDRILTIRGAGKDATIVNANAQGRGFRFQASASFFAIEDLTITAARSGDSHFGGGMFIDGPLQGSVRRVRFLDNVAGRSGGAMYVRGTTPGLSLTISRCEFVGNTALGINHAGQGGAIWSGFDTANVAVFNSLFDGNSSETNGLALTTQNSGIAFDFINCTFVNHPLATDGNERLISSASGAQVGFYNSIFAANQATVMDGSGTGSVVRHCLIGSMSIVQVDEIVGNDTGTPTFVDAANGDYRLAAGSLGIDAGDSTVFGLTGVTGDLDGLTRRVDDPATPDTGAGTAPIVDIGCYEYRPEGTFTSLGGGCTTATGFAPTFATTSGAPSIGQDLRFAVFSPGSMTAFAGFGFHQLGAPAGIELAVLGAPGCILHSDLLLALPTTPDGSDVTLAIPMDLGLLGASFYAQGVVIHPGSNALGIALSHGYHGTFGYPQ